MIHHLFIHCITFGSALLMLKGEADCKNRYGFDKKRDVLTELIFGIVSY